MQESAANRAGRRVNSKYRSSHTRWNTALSRTYRKRPTAQRTPDKTWKHKHVAVIAAGTCRLQRAPDLQPSGGSLNDLSPVKGKLLRPAETNTVNVNMMAADRAVLFIRTKRLLLRDVLKAH